MIVGQPRVFVNPGESHFSSPAVAAVYRLSQHPGFIAMLTDRDWRTLWTLAILADDQELVRHSRTVIVQWLGVRPCTVSDRMQHLLTLRWHGEPLLRVLRSRCPDGRWGEPRYLLLPTLLAGAAED
jgi:hypothetical protein